MFSKAMAVLVLLRVLHSFLTALGLEELVTGTEVETVETPLEGADLLAFEAGKLLWNEALAESSAGSFEWSSISLKNLYQQKASYQAPVVIHFVQVANKESHLD